MDKPTTLTVHGVPRSIVEYWARQASEHIEGGTLIQAARDALAAEANDALRRDLPA